MIEHLETRTLYAVDPSSVTWPGYVELAITKAGRLIVHNGEGSTTLQISVGPVQPAVLRMRAQSEHSAFTFSMYTEETRRFEQLSFAAETDVEAVITAAGALGEMRNGSHYVFITDGDGMNLFIRSRFVQMFHFDMGSGSDAVRLYEDLGRPSLILGGSGNDKLISARSGDTIAGGVGDDVIVSSADNQLLIGGRGNDTFITRSTKQSVFGGAGRDTASQAGYANVEGVEEYYTL